MMLKWLFRNRLRKSILRVIASLHDGDHSDQEKVLLCDLKRGLRNHFDARKRTVK